MRNRIDRYILQIIGRLWIYMEHNAGFWAAGVSKKTGVPIHREPKPTPAPPPKEYYEE